MMTHRAALLDLPAGGGKIVLWEREDVDWEQASSTSARSSNPSRRQLLHRPRPQWGANEAGGGAHSSARMDLERKVRASFRRRPRQGGRVPGNRACGSPVRQRARGQLPIFGPGDGRVAAVARSSSGETGSRSSGRTSPQFLHRSYGAALGIRTVEAATALDVRGAVQPNAVGGAAGGARAGGPAARNRSSPGAPRRPRRSRPRGRAVRHGHPLRAGLRHQLCSSSAASSSVLEGRRERGVNDRTADRRGSRVVVLRRQAEAARAAPARVAVRAWPRAPSS